MKCIFLAAGYATRLYPITENFPKPLLPVKGQAILDYLIDDLEANRFIDEYIVISNGKFFNIFNEWKKNHKYNKKITIINDGTFTNETRLGAVIDIKFAIDTLKLDDDLLIMAGDNLLDFSLKGFIDMFRDAKTTLVMAYKENDVNRLRKSAVLFLNGNKVVNFEEKPISPKSNWCCPPFYIYKKDDVNKINQAIKDGCKTDAPGSLVTWFVKNSSVSAYFMEGKRYDIGSLEDYENVKNL